MKFLGTDVSESPIQPPSSARALAILRTARVDSDALLADARALWAVRVLDAWGRVESCVRVGMNDGPALDCWYVLLEYDSPRRPNLKRFTGETPDAARLAAADAVFPELPADVRAKLGERP